MTMIEQDLHARYSPSKLPRIIACPASGKYEQIDDPSASNQYADEGTMLHAVMRECLDNNIYSLSPTIVQKFSLDRPNQDAIQECLDYVWALRQSMFSPFYDLVETRVSLTNWQSLIPCDELIDVAGTLDYALITTPPPPAPRTLYITDWKFGKGIEVFPDSEQLYAYALGILADPRTASLFDQVHLTIMQPRLTQEDHIKTLITSVDALQEWLQVVLAPALISINAKHPIYKPSTKACRWCPNKITCPARHSLVSQLATEVFALHGTLVDPTSTPPTIEQLVALHEQAPLLKEYLADIAVHLMSQIQHGFKVPGYKLVEGKTNRAWKNEAEAVKWCVEHNVDPDKMFTSKLFSPAQAEKVIGAKLKRDPSFTSLVIKPEGNPTLAREDDKRPALMYRTAEQIFSDILIED